MNHPLPGPFSEHDLIQRWNAQADNANQWDSLDTCEQLAWAQTCAIEADRSTHPAPPAPEVQRDAVIAAVTEALGNAYDCLRVWDAWGIGTMGQDDFALVAEDDDRVAEIADAAIEAMRPAAPAVVPEPGNRESEAQRQELKWQQETLNKLRSIE